jgi:hypothetical protein
MDEYKGLSRLKEGLETYGLNEIKMVKANRLDDKVEIFKESFNNYKFNNSTFFYFYRSL